jgi:hypothetical protein
VIVDSQPDSAPYGSINPYDGSPTGALMEPLTSPTLTRPANVAVSVPPLSDPAAYIMADRAASLPMSLSAHWFGTAQLDGSLKITIQSV